MKNEITIGMIMLMICSVLLAGCGAGEKAGKSTDVLSTDAICISMWKDYNDKCGDPCVKPTDEECSKIYDKYSAECKPDCERLPKEEPKEEPKIEEESAIEKGTVEGQEVVQTNDAIVSQNITETQTDEPVEVVADRSITGTNDEAIYQTPATNSEGTINCVLCAPGAVVATHCENDLYWEDVYDGTQDPKTCDCGIESTKPLHCEDAFPGTKGCSATATDCV